MKSEWVVFYLSVNFPKINRSTGRGHETYKNVRAYGLTRRGGSVNFINDELGIKDEHMNRFLRTLDKLDAKFKNIIIVNKSLKEIAIERIIDFGKATGNNEPCANFVSDVIIEDDSIDINKVPFDFSIFHEKVIATNESIKSQSTLARQLRMKDKTIGSRKKGIVKIRKQRTKEQVEQKRNEEPLQLTTSTSSPIAIEERGTKRKTNKERKYDKSRRVDDSDTSYNINPTAQEYIRNANLFTAEETIVSRRPPKIGAQQLVLYQQPSSQPIPPKPAPKPAPQPIPKPAPQLILKPGAQMGLGFGLRGYSPPPIPANERHEDHTGYGLNGDNIKYKRELTFGNEYINPKLLEFSHPSLRIPPKDDLAKFHKYSPMINKPICEVDKMKKESEDIFKRTSLLKNFYLHL